MISPPLNAGQPIVNEDGTMSDAFRTWAGKVSLSIPLTGVGSPEGVIEARQFQLYLNTAGITGSIEYRKMLASVAGDVKRGWVLL